MQTERKKAGKKSLCLMLAILMLLGTLLSIHSDKVRAESYERLDYDITVYLKIVPKDADTPDPGRQVFHFNIISEAGVPLNITNNAIYTYGYGTAEGHLTFSVSSAPDAERMQWAPVYVQQYDGNEDWIFDMRQAEFCYNTREETFLKDWYYGDAGYDFINTYAPAVPPTPVTPDPPTPVTPDPPTPPAPETPDPPVNPGPETTEPEPQPDGHLTENGPEDDEDEEADDGLYINHGSLTCSIRPHKAFLPKNGEYYNAGDEVVLWVFVFNSTNGKSVFDIYFYETAGVYGKLSTKEIKYDPIYYPEFAAGESWHIEKLPSGNTASFKYCHKITPEEAKAGKVFVQIYCCGTDRYGKDYQSNNAEIELKTSGVYYDPHENDEPEEEKPLKKQLTLELYESSQPKHPKGTQYFYTMGDMVKFKLVVKNETLRYFYDIEVTNDLVEDEVFHLSELAPGRSKAFYFYARVGQVNGQRSHLTCTASMVYKDWYDQYYKDQSNHCLVDTAVID